MLVRNELVDDNDADFNKGRQGKYSSGSCSPSDVSMN